MLTVLVPIYLAWKGSGSELANHVGEDFEMEHSFRMLVRNVAHYDDLFAVEGCVHGGGKVESSVHRRGRH